MPQYRVTSFFGQANMGWSETWWINKTTINEAIKAAALMLEFRNDLLTRIHSILAFRVATEGQNAKSQLLLPGRQGLAAGQEAVDIPGVGDYPEGSTNLGYDQVRANLQVVYLNQGEKVSLRYMVGIPDISSKTEAATLDTTSPAQWWQRFATYHVHLQSAGWTIKALNRGPENPFRNIVRWVNRGTPPSVAGIQLAQGSSVAVAVGDKVQVSGVKMADRQMRAPNGQWTVDEVVAGTSQAGPTIYLRRSEALDLESIDLLGKFRPVSYIYRPFDQVRALRMGIHQRGKPFNSPVGRRKSKR